MFSVSHSVRVAGRVLSALVGALLFTVAVMFLLMLVAFAVSLVAGTPLAIPGVASWSAAFPAGAPVFQFSAAGPLLPAAAAALAAVTVFVQLRGRARRSMA
jgi:hypothetical protein